MFWHDKVRAAPVETLENADFQRPDKLGFLSFRPVMDGYALLAALAGAFPTYVNLAAMNMFHMSFHISNVVEFCRNHLAMFSNWQGRLGSSPTLHHLQPLR